MMGGKNFGLGIKIWETGAFHMGIQQGADVAFSM